jgi:signal transduction histidine kinase
MVNNAVVEGQNISTEEVIGLPCYQISAHNGSNCPNSNCPATRTFATGKLEKVLHTHGETRETRRYIEIYSSPLVDEDGKVNQVIEVMRDVTEREHLEAQLIYSEKLFSVGRIAAGMAHEINNPIAAIAACAEGLQRRSKGWEIKADKTLDDLPQYLEKIKQNAYRCKEITQNMLTFSRQTEPTFEWGNPNDMIKDILDFVEYEVKSAHKNIELNLAEDIPLIQADKSQLSQVFLNLIHNGLDAMDAAGEITITTRKVSESIEILFEDTGCGITKENLRNIFEPFFTTKPPGKGTGLGLSISESIIRKHSGTITATSKIGRGTTFRIVLPIEQRPADLYSSTRN